MTSSELLDRERDASVGHYGEWRAEMDCYAMCHGADQRVRYKGLQQQSFCCGSFRVYRRRLAEFRFFRSRSSSIDYEDRAVLLRWSRASSNFSESGRYWHRAPVLRCLGRSPRRPSGVINKISPGLSVQSWRNRSSRSRMPES